MADADALPLYRVKNLRVSFPDLTNRPLFGAAPGIEVLKGLSLEIPQGQVLGIVGGSGSGKSTLGRALVRLLKPTEGRIVFDGVDITRRPERELAALRRRFQMIFQDPMSSLNPRQSVARIIAAPLSLHKIANAHVQALDALERVGLQRDFGARYPHELSGGQRQRVGIARAIALKPDFIVADEIVSGLDVSSQAQILLILRNLVRDMGLTLAFISHDLSVVRRLCDRVLVMHHGEIVEDAPCETLFSAPKAAYTLELLNAIPEPDPDNAWFQRA